MFMCFTWYNVGFVFQFLRDELKYTDGFERHSAFHGHDDAITVNDLWHLWVKSEG